MVMSTYARSGVLMHLSFALVHMAMEMIRIHMRMMMHAFDRTSHTWTCIVECKPWLVVCGFNMPCISEQAMSVLGIPCKSTQQRVERVNSVQIGASMHEACMKAKVVKINSMAQCIASWVAL